MGGSTGYYWHLYRADHRCGDELPFSSVQSSGGREVAFRIYWGVGGTRYNLTIQKSAPCGPKRGPCARGNYVEFFFRALPNRVIFEKNGQFQDFARIEKRGTRPFKITIHSDRS